MKRYLFVLNLMLSVITFSQTIIPAGNVSGLWKKSKSPYKINGDILVPDDSTLTIEPGVKIVFQGYYAFLVQGTLIASGNKTDSISFTVQDTTGFSDTSLYSGCWKGIWFNNGYTGAFGKMDNNSPSALEYCSFQNVNAVKKTLSYLGQTGVIKVEYFDKISIRHCDFRNCINSFQGCAITCENNSDILIENNTIHHNRTYHNYGIAGIYAISSSPTIKNNIISNNACNTYSSTAGIYTSYCRSKIIQNIICNNFGGALIFANSDNIILNNTIVNNIQDGAPVYIISGRNVFVNNIFWGNRMYFINKIRTIDFHFYEISKTSLYNNLLEGGMDTLQGITDQCIFVGNIDGTPAFVNPSAGAGSGYDGLAADWRLTTNSPCINNGTTNINTDLISTSDFYGNNRVRFSGIDIGTHEFYQSSMFACTNIKSNAVWAADTVRVCSDIIIDTAQLRILPGVRVEFQDNYSIRLRGSSIIAVGKPDSKILFTTKDTTGFSNRSVEKGGWGCIKYLYHENDYPLTDTSRFVNCIFEYGKEINNSQTERAGVFFIDAFNKIDIHHCLFRNNYGMEAGVLYLSRAWYSLNNNEFLNNSSDGNIIKVKYSQSLQIINTKIANNNSAFAAIAIEDSYVDILNTLLVNNNIALAASSSNINIQNTTIANHSSYNSINIMNSKMAVFNSIITQSPCSINKYSDVSIVNSCITGGKNSITGGDYISKYLNNIDTTVYFIAPSTGNGILFDGINADWNLQDISPCINNGTLAASLTISAVDYAGNPRINSSSIDIGAYENSGSLPTISLQPVAGPRCENDSIVLKTNTPSLCYYQWMKDGSILPGANNNSFKIPKLSTANEGNYSCNLTNSYGTSSSQSVYLAVHTKPEILLESKKHWVNGNDPIQLEVAVAGSKPLTYQWFLNGTPVPNENEPAIKIDTFNIANEGRYYLRSENECGYSTSSPQDLYMAPQLCMVTVDTSINKNKIIWEKNSKASLLKYNIYRQGMAAGFFDPIGSVPASSLTVFTDSAADPRQQSEWYKVTAVDASGNESDINLCTPHKTIHLLVTKGYMGGIQLDWNGYFGFPFNTYEIFRSAGAGQPYTSIHSIASNNYSWTDLSVNSEGFLYMVSVKKESVCDPADLLKADSGPYAQSLSNIVEFKSSGISAINSSVAIFPNPATDKVTVYSEKTGTLILSDISGRPIKQINILTDETSIDLTDVARGIYLISIQTTEGKVVKKLLVE